mgnify:CR=1 FL=1
MTTYAVFRQTAKLIRYAPQEEWAVNFEYMGNVEAATSDDAFNKAKGKYCAAPVLERKDMQ